jgi:hypothetical protein
MLLYCNSDSYGVLSTTKNRYSDYLGELLQADTIINNGLPGSCNARIIRTTVRDILDVRKDNNDSILAVVCLASMIRNEWWNPNKTLPNGFNDGHFESFQIHGVKNNQRLPCYHYTQEWYRHYNDEAEQTNLFKELIMLTSFLKQQKVNYIMFAGNNLTYKPLDYLSPFIKTFAEKIQDDPNILDLNNFSFTQYCLQHQHVPFDKDQWGIHGHHGELAHQDFAKFLFNHYDKVS